MSTSINLTKLKPNFCMAILSLIVLIILILLSVFMVSEVAAPIFLLAKSILIDDNVQLEYKFEISTIFNILISAILLILSFIVYFVTSAMVTYNLYKIVAKEFITEDYNLKDLIQTALRCYLQKIYWNIRPVLFIGGIGLFLFLLTMIFFNLILVMSGISLGITAFIFTLAFILFCLSFLVSFAISLWNLAVSLFRTEITISEPGLSSNTIINRSRKLAFLKPHNIVLHLLSFLFTGFLALQFVNAVLFTKFISIDNILLISLIIMIDLGLFIGLKLLKINFYISSIQFKYNKITILNDNLTYNL